MRKIVTIILFLLMILSLVSCSDKEEIITLEDEIVSVKADIDKIERELTEKKDMLDNLVAEYDELVKIKEEAKEKVYKELESFSYDDLLKYFMATTSDIINVFGEDYKNVTMEAGNSIGLKYDEKGVIFETGTPYEKSHIHRIYLTDETEYKGIKAGMTMSEAKGILGSETRIIGENAIESTTLVYDYVCEGVNLFLKFDREDILEMIYFEDTNRLDKRIGNGTL